MWSASRWQAYNIMAAWADLAKAGIHSPKDLLQFPWEKTTAKASIPTDEEVEEMKQILLEMQSEAH